LREPARHHPIGAGLGKDHDVAGSIYDVLDRLRASATSEADKGSKLSGC